MAEIQAQSSRLEVQKNLLDSDLQNCERTSKEAAAEAAKQLQDKQKTHDDQVDDVPAHLVGLDLNKNLHHTVP